MKYVCVVVSAGCPFTNSLQRTTVFLVIAIAEVMDCEPCVGMEPSNVHLIWPPFCGVGGSMVRLL